MQTEFIPDPERPRLILFSDLDGTLIHYDQYKHGSFTGRPADNGRVWFKDKRGRKHQLLALPPSTNGLQGYISLSTLKLMQTLRQEGVIIVLISGARSSTFFQRLPWLPRADAYVCENGGRVFFPDPEVLCAAPLIEDMAWRNQLTAAGPVGQDGVAPEERQGELWDIFRRLKQDGHQLDAMNYTTNFRLVRVAEAWQGDPETDGEGHQEAVMRMVTSGLPSGLSSTCNLGCADIYPSNSGKDKAMQYLLRHFGMHQHQSVVMCDDDNDIPMAMIASHAYLPSVGASSMDEMLRTHPHHFTRAAENATMATDEILTKMLSSTRRRKKVLRQRMAKRARMEAALMPVEQNVVEAAADEQEQE